MEQDSVSMKGRVTLYSVPGCPRCSQARATLNTLGVSVWDVDVNEHRDLRSQVRELTGQSTLPQIFFNNLYVGNNENLQNLDAEQLKRLVLSVREEPVPADAPPVPEENIHEYPSKIGGACELSEELRNLVLKLYSNHLSKDGKTLNYMVMSQSAHFKRYCLLSIKLQHMELLSLSREEKLAFFINIYNALVIHGTVRLGFPRNVWQRYKFFNYVSYLIGGEVFTLQDIVNGVLRANQKGVAQLLKPFSKSDPRLQVALSDPEPLVHFALNCGTRSCPPVKVYSPEDIDGQLRAAAEGFLENDDCCVIDSVGREVKLSCIFKWYRTDFGDTDDKLLNWVFNHMSVSQKRRNLQALLSEGKVKVSYLPYDWSRNSTD